MHANKPDGQSLPDRYLALLPIGAGKGFVQIFFARSSVRDYLCIINRNVYEWQLALFVVSQKDQRLGRKNVPTAVASSISLKALAPRLAVMLLERPEGRIRLPTTSVINAATAHRTITEWSLNACVIILRMNTRPNQRKIQITVACFPARFLNRPTT